MATNMAGETVVSTLNPPEGGPPPVETPEETGASSIPDKTSSEKSDLIKTIGLDTPKEEVEVKGEVEKKDEAAIKEPEAKIKDDEDRFDKHPRFQELRTTVEQLKERALKAEAKLEVLTTKEPVAEQYVPGETPDFENIAEMEDVDIKEKFEENPRQFLANLARQLSFEVRNSLMKTIDERDKTKSYQGAVNKTYDEFSGKNQDFQGMIDSGRISKFISGNPGHNAISAYHELKADDRETEVRGRIDKAVKEREEKLRSDFKVKREASVLGDGGGGSLDVPRGTPPELVDTKKHGGLTNALVARLRARRAAGA